MSDGQGVASDGWGSPTPSSGAAEAVDLVIGDIGVSANWVVTPNGTAPLAGSSWIVRDSSVTTKDIPAWAWVCCVLTFWTVFGLLFLLVRRTTTSGYAEVQVRAGAIEHLVQIPISDPRDVDHWRGLVSQAQRMAATAAS